MNNTKTLITKPQDFNSANSKLLELIKRKVVKFIKDDTILFISGILAIVSCFFVKPDSQYIDYINFRVLAILFSLMLVVSAYIRIGTFDFLTGKLLKSIHSEKRVSLLLVNLSFFMSMFLTNDVTLVTLVPFAINVLKAYKDRRRTMYTLILMTVSANLGSMLTPIGNPQNIYLYTKFHFNLTDFVLMMLPFGAVSLILLIVSVLVLNATDKTLDTAVITETETPKISKLLIYSALFILCLLTVTETVHYLIMLAVVAVIILIADKKAFASVDFSLLLTFVFFFILIGNLGRISIIHDTLSVIIEKNVTLTSILASQIISNVPAAMLLSAFTDNGKALVIGTNLGGLGTLIASMASLITYKYFNKIKKKGEHYLLTFTVINIIFLVILVILNVILNHMV